MAECMPPSYKGQMLLAAGPSLWKPAAPTKGLLGKALVVSLKL